MDFMKGFSNSVLDRLYKYGFTSRQCQKIGAKETDYIGIPLDDNNITHYDTSEKSTCTDKSVVTEKDAIPSQDNLGYRVMRVVDIDHNEIRAHKSSAASAYDKDKVEHTKKVKCNQDVPEIKGVKVEVELPKPVTKSAPSTCTVRPENNSTFGKVVLKSEPNSPVVRKDVVVNNVSRPKPAECRINSGVVNIKTEKSDVEQHNDESVSVMLKPSKEQSNVLVTEDEPNSTCCASVNDQQITEPLINDVPACVLTDQDRASDSFSEVQSNSVSKTKELSNSSMQAEIYVDVDFDGTNNCINDYVAIEDIQNAIHISADTETRDQQDLDVSGNLYASFASEESSDSFLEEPVNFLKPTTNLKMSGENKSDVASEKEQKLTSKPGTNINGIDCISHTQFSENYWARFKLKKAIVILRRCDADLQHSNSISLKTRRDKDVELPYTHSSNIGSIGIDIECINAKEQPNRTSESKTKESMDTNNNVKVSSVKKTEHIDKSDDSKRLASTKSKTSDEMKRAEELKEKSKSTKYSKQLKETDKNNIAATVAVQHVSKGSFRELNNDITIKTREVNASDCGKSACSIDQTNANVNSKERTRDKAKADCLIQQCSDVESIKQNETKKHASLREEQTTKADVVEWKTHKKYKHSPKNKVSQNSMTSEDVKCANQPYTDAGCENTSDTPKDSHCSKTHKRRHSSDEYGLTREKHQKQKRISDEMNKLELKITDENNDVNNKPVNIGNESKSSKTASPNSNVVNSETRNRIWDWLAASDKLADDKPLRMNSKKKKNILQNKLHYRIPKKVKEIENDKADIELNPKIGNIRNADDRNMVKKSDRKHKSHKKKRKVSKILGESHEHSKSASCGQTDRKNAITINKTGVEKIRKRHRHESKDNAMNKKAKYKNEDLQRKTFDKSVGKLNAVTMNSNVNHNNVDILCESEGRNIEETSVIQDIGKTKTGISETCDENPSVGFDKLVENNTLGQPKELDIHNDKVKGGNSVDLNNNQKVVSDFKAICHNIEQAVEKSIAHIRENTNNAVKDNDTKKDHGVKKNTYERLKMCSICECVLFQCAEELKLHEAKCKTLETHGDGLEHSTNNNHKSKSDTVRRDEFSRDIQASKDRTRRSGTSIECKNDPRNRNLSGTSAKENVGVSVKDNKTNDVYVKEARSKQKIEVPVKVAVEKEHTQVNKQRETTNYSSNGNTIIGKAKMFMCENCNRAWYNNMYDLKCHQKNCSSAVYDKEAGSKQDIEVPVKIAVEKEHTQVNNQRETNYSSKGNAIIGKAKMFMCENCNRAWYNNMFDLKCHQKKCSPLTIPQVKNRETIWARNKNTTVVSKVVKEMSPIKSASNKVGDTHQIECGFATNPEREMCRICKAAYFNTKGELMKHVKLCNPCPRREMCRICKTAYFNNKEELMKHVRLCNPSPRREMCRICKAAYFNTKGELMKHVRLCNPCPRREMCRICKAAYFNTKGELMKHVRLCNPCPRREMCRICKAAYFNNKEELMKHVKLCNPCPRREMCRICKTAYFNNKEELMKHVRLCNPSPRTEMCRICKASYFNTRKLLMKHVIVCRSSLNKSNTRR